MSDQRQEQDPLQWWGHQPGHVPLGRPPWLSRWLSRSRWWSPVWWWRWSQLRLVRWFFRRGMFPPLDEILTLRLLVLGLTVVVILETFLLLISPCVPLLLDVSG